MATKAAKKRARKGTQRHKRSTANNRLGRGLKDGLAPVPATKPDLEQAAAHGNSRAASFLGVGTEASPLVEDAGRRPIPSARETLDTNRPPFRDAPTQPQDLQQQLSELTKQYAHDVRTAVETFLGDIYTRAGV